MLNKLQKSKKGMAFELLYILVTCFIVILMYVIFDEVVSNTMIPLGASMGCDANVLDLLEKVWNLFPFLVIMISIVWAFARSQKKEYDTGVSGY